MFAYFGQGHKEFTKSRWFNRGWTLQELIAPQNVIFYNKRWVEIGTRETRRDIIGKITGIDRHFFTHGVLSRYSIAQKMSWAANRVTTRIEDQAYCLLGLFGVNMPLLYGEGEMAFIRLQEEIMRRTNDQSIFAWFEPTTRRRTGFLASSPVCFANSGSVTVYQPDDLQPPYSFTNQGISISLQVLPSGVSGFQLPFVPSEQGEIASAAGIQFSFSPTGTVAILNCKNAQSWRVGIYMEKEDEKSLFYRSNHQIGFVSVPNSVVARSKFENILVGSSNPEDADSLWKKSQSSHHIIVNWHVPHGSDPKPGQIPCWVAKTSPAGSWVEHEDGHSVVLSFDYERFKPGYAWLHFDSRIQECNNNFCVFFLVDSDDVVKTFIDKNPRDVLHTLPPDPYHFNNDTVSSAQLPCKSEDFEKVEVRLSTRWTRLGKVYDLSLQGRDKADEPPAYEL